MIKNRYIKFIINILSKHKFQQFLGLLFTLLYSFLVFCGPLISQRLVDNVLSVKESEISKNYFIIFSIVCLLQPVFSYIQNYIYIKISENITMDLRNMMFNKMLYKDIKFFQNNSRGEILSKLLNDTRMISDFVADIFLVLVKNFILIVSISIGMFIICWYITLAIFILLIIFILIFIYFSKKNRIFSKIRQKTYDEVSTFIEDSVSNIVSIKVYNLISMIYNKYNKKILENKKSNVLIRKKNNLFSVLLESITVLCIILIYFIGFKSLLGNIITVGDIVALVLYFQLIINPILSLMNCNLNFQVIIPIIERIEAFLKENEYFIYKGMDEKVSDKNNKIVIKNLKFYYEEKNPLFTNFNAEIETRSLTCIAGKSGMGKTTLVYLLTGILHPLEGNILVDNESIYANTTKSKILFVPQNCHLFHMSIMENIKLDNESICDEDVYKICKRLNIYEDIKLFDKGFNTVITDHINISGGQAQRILIARALIQNPEILVLDEPTSALDKENREKILELLRELCKQYTVIVITHDENVLEIADNIILLEKEEGI